jgi:hypothetical protein
VNALAHRVCWEITYGEIPEGLHVLHRCDNPSCVNPEHLFLGTHADNMQDSSAKGRRNPCSGEKNGRARLTAEAVAQIRGEHLSDHSIAEKYGISRRQVGRILRREQWGAV